MNKGLFQNFLVQQMMMGAGGGGGGGGGSGASCWSNINSLRSPPAPPEQAFPLFPLPNSSSSSPSSSSSSPSSVYGHHHHYPQGMLPAAVTPPNLHDAAGQDHHLPESWSQFLLGGYNLGEAENKYGMTTGRKMENSLEDHLVLIPSSASAAAADHIKQEFSNCHAAGFNNNNLHAHGSSNNTSSNTAEGINKAQWNQILPASSPCSSRSNCISASTFSPRNMLDFTNMNTNSQSDPRILHHQSSDNNNNSSECNSSTTATGVALKKARVQGSSSSAHSTFKVRKEKLGDRITALHQIVSPFGKTDTASVLLEAIGYIRFLQSQIEALSSPYLSNGPAGNMKQHHQQQPAVTPSNETGNGKKRGPPELQESGKNDNDSHGYNEEASKKKKQKDLRSRGLCLVPVSFFLHVGGEHVNGADYWASALHGAF